VPGREVKLLARKRRSRFVGFHQFRDLEAKLTCKHLTALANFETDSSLHKYESSLTSLVGPSKHQEVAPVKNDRRTWQALRVLGFVAVLVAQGGAGGVLRADSFAVRNLVTDDPTANPAPITDPNLVNAWGISSSGTSPFWVSSNGKSLSTVYKVDPVTGVPTKQNTEVSIPGDGSVTGQVFNGTSAFNNDRFLFVNEDGTISGWHLGLVKAEILQSPSDAVYKGAALATIGGNTYLYAANFHSGAIDVLKGTPGAPNLGGNFTDPGLPAGFAPFNIQLLGDKLYVAYAMQGAGKDEQAGPGLGFVSVFDTQGNLIGRVGSQGTLNAPWGLAIAPESFGSFAGDLLVGNFGDGTINAFDLKTNTFVGQLTGPDGKVLSIDGLWGLSAGNGGNGGSKDSIYFAAGPGDESHGLFGVISSIPEPSTVALGLIAVGMFTARWGFNRVRAGR
jgi:uncharacterized protein (TIGR03118 family)